MMALSSRTRAIAVAAMTAGAAITGFAHPASAQDAKMINVATTDTDSVPALGEFLAQCDKFKDNVKWLQCSVDQTNAHTEAMRKIERVLDKRLASLKDEGVCLDILMKDLMAGGEKTAGLNAPPPKGQACKYVRDLNL
jgi:uncharacterized protein YggE